MWQKRLINDIKTIFDINTGYFHTRINLTSVYDFAYRPMNKLGTQSVKISLRALVLRCRPVNIIVCSFADFLIAFCQNSVSWCHSWLLKRIIMMLMLLLWLCEHCTRSHMYIYALHGLAVMPSTAGHSAFSRLRADASVVKSHDTFRMKYFVEP